MLLAVTACSSGDEDPGDTGSESNTSGSGGSDGGSSSGGTSSGGASSGGTSSGGTSSGGTPSAGGSSSAGPLLGSCDTREVAGPSQGQCRDWIGEDSNLDLSVSCNGLDGMFSDTEACPSTGRVGQCDLGRVILGATAVYGYYAPDYTLDTAADHCSALDGVFTPASTGSGTGGAGGAGGSPPSGGSGGRTPCPPECFRPYECVAMCGDEPVSYGCCPCPDGMIDTITCP